MSDKENKPLNKIIRETKGSKKFKVFVKIRYGFYQDPFRRHY